MVYSGNLLLESIRVAYTTYIMFRLSTARCVHVYKTVMQNCPHYHVIDMAKTALWTTCICVSSGNTKCTCTIVYCDTIRTCSILYMCMSVKNEMLAHDSVRWKNQIQWKRSVQKPTTHTAVRVGRSSGDLWQEANGSITTEVRPLNS